MKLDILIYNGIVLTMERPGPGIIENGVIGIRGNRIALVAQGPEARKGHKAVREIDASGKVVMPGFIDVHMHTGDTIVRG